MYNEILLSVRNLKKEYENIFLNNKSKMQVLNDVNFDIYKGECLALVGESGCGKSTLAKLIMSLEEKNYGEIIFEDLDISKLNKKDKKTFTKNIQMVFQDPYSSLNPRMKIFDILAEPLRAHKIYQDKKKLKETVYFLMEKVGILKEFSNRYPHQFSGGQRQRIAIARAIALNPKLLILDEAVSALDVSVQAQILNLLKDIKKDNKISYLFISHDLSVVKFISDRFMVMYLGQIVEIGKTDDIFTNPRHPYTKLLLDSIPRLIPDCGINFEQNDIDKEDLDKDILLSSNSKICKFYHRCPYAKDICMTKQISLKYDANGNAYACHFPLGG